MQITSLSEFDHEVATYKGLIVVDFYADWCGPCKAIAPFINELEAKYPDVKFLKVNVDECQDIAAPRRIQSIPTFHFMLKGNLVDELKGASKPELEAKIIKHKVDVNPFAGAGFKLTSDPSTAGMSIREARLKQFAKLEGPRKEIVPSPQSISNTAVTKDGGNSNNSSNINNLLKTSLLTEDDIDEDEALSKALQLSLAEPKATTNKAPTTNNSFANKQEEAEFASAAAELDALDEQNRKDPEHFQETPGQEWDEEMVPVPVDQGLLDQLIDMGFSDTRSRKGIYHGKTLDGAVTWLTEHLEDPDIDQPYMVKKADTIPKPPLTEEEKALRIQAVKDLMKERKAERLRQEKADEIKREKERRERGQKIDETVEERQRLQRKREADKMKKEKEDAAKERLRLKQEIARDKEIRKANKGVLPSVLGVDGYNPSIIQYDVPVSSSGKDSTTTSTSTTGDSKNVVPSKRSNDDAKSSVPSAVVASTSSTKSAVDATVKKVPSKAPSSSSSSSTTMSAADKVDSAIQTILRYRTGGDGGHALKLLLTFVRNVVEHPDEPKYKSINTESGAFKSKLSSLVGPMLLLKAVGFEKGEEEGKIVYTGDLPSELLSDTLLKLTNAESLYRQQNP